MSLSKFEIIDRARNENRKVEFVFKKDATVREVEIYDYYVDSNGVEKLWVYQTHNEGSRAAGPRCFLESDATYMVLLSETFAPRAAFLADGELEVAPKKAYTI